MDNYFAIFRVSHSVSTFSDLGNFQFKLAPYFLPFLLFYILFPLITMQSLCLFTCPVHFFHILFMAFQIFRFYFSKVFLVFQFVYSRHFIIILFALKYLYALFVPLLTVQFLGLYSVTLYI